MDFASDPHAVRCGGHPTTILLCSAGLPRDGAELACYRAVLKTLLEDLFHVAIAYKAEPHHRARPSLGWGAVSVPIESQLRFDGEGWAQVAIFLHLGPLALRSAASCPDLKFCQLASEISFQARLARTPDRLRLAVEWRLPESFHPRLRAERRAGAVTSEPLYDFLTLTLPTRPAAVAAGAAVAEPAPQPAAMPVPARPRAPRREPPSGSGLPPPPAERALTIAATRVESRSRFEYRRADRYLPTVRIAARWLAAFGFDIGQRVRVQAEAGRLVLTSIPADGPGGEDSQL